MDLVRLASPWLLLLALPAWAAILYAAAASRPRRAGAAGRAALSCAAAGLLAAALAGPSLRISQEGRCPVIFLEDISPSMTAHRNSDPAEETMPYINALPRGHAGLVVFDGAARTIVEPFTRDAQVRSFSHARGLPRLVAAATAPETDIQAALEHAARLDELAGGRGIVLLYTDARQTRGDAVRAADALAARGTRVFAAAPALQVRDVRVAGITATAPAAPGATVAIQVRLASTVSAPATVRLRRAAGGPAPAADWQREVQVDPASGAAILFEDTPPAPGYCTYHAQVTSAADEWPENNQASCMIRTGEGLDVLYVYGGDSPGAALEALRARAPAAVRLRDVPAGRFSRPSAADAVIVLDNVAAWSLQPETLQSLAARVADGGMGLLVLGGDAAFGAGGYGQSPLEDLLPVSSRMGRRPPLQIVFVIDSSGSMNEVADGFTKLTHAKSAVLDLGSALGPDDRAGIVAFAGEPRVASPLVPADAWEQLRERLVAMEAGGGTRITPAVAAALALFAAQEPDAATLRHIVLLSDGRSADFDVPLLAAECRRAKASLSAVATGPDADRDRLAALAREAGGRLYVLTRPGGQALRETFLKDMAWARGEGLLRESRPARWQQPEPIWRRAGPPLPAVDAVNPTQAKPGADVLWQADAPAAGRPPAPLLAAWRKGLGKAAAMPWPAGRPPPSTGGRTGPQAWLQGDALGNYLSAILAWLGQAQAPADWSARLEARGSEWWVRVEERPAALGKPPARFAATVFGERAAEARQADLQQVAPGIHEAKVGSLGEGAAVVVLRRRPAGSPAAPGAAPGGRQTDWRPSEAAPAAHADADATVSLPVPGLPPLEYGHLGLDRGQLEAIVQAGGGAILDSPDQLADIVRRTETQGYLPVGLHLVAGAGLVIVLQVGLRLAGRL
ncbi:MAG: VWA domain-containing protein [Planctomycetota bacterium]|nr:VWA domain-containing protein [Planctomycetota bacterium]